MTPLQLLHAVCVENYDNGAVFTVRTRLDMIGALTAASPYRLVRDDALFHLYGKRDIVENDTILLVSTHVDCSHDITKCSSALADDATLRGTYDNAITNAAALKIMLDGEIADHVFFAFTGDEECESRGARRLSAYLNALHVSCRCIVLDVTGMGVLEQASFTVENNFFDDDFGKMVVACAQETGFPWRFVPEDPDDIPAYVDAAHLIPIESQPDESWEYDDLDVACFSLCLPCEGEMHCNEGVTVRLQAYEDYIEALRLLVTKCA